MAIRFFSHYVRIAAALNGHIIPLSPANTTWGAPSPACGVAIAPSWFVVGGQNVLTVFVTNIYAVAMGLNADVSVTGSGLIPLGSPCCQFGSGLSGQAVAVLQPLVQAQPGKVNLQGNYLAALYRSRNAPDFNRAFTRATANGITTKGLITVPAFKAALVEEGQLQRKKPSAGLLSEDAFKRVVDGL